MLRQQAFRFAICPTGAQVRQMRRTAGACRFVYNRALALQAERFAAGEPKLNYASLCRELTAWRHDPSTAWLADAPIHPLQQALRDLERAYTNFFAKRAARPAFKKKDRSAPSFRYPDPSQITLGEANARIRLPKLGWVTYRASRPVQGAVRNVTVSERAGRWYVSVQTEREVEAPTHPALGTSQEAIGVDVGIANFAACSDGTLIAPLNSFRRHERRLARAQRDLARKQQGSRNRTKARRRVARIHARIADARSDFLHQLSHTISKTHAVVVVEDLQVRAMSTSSRGTKERPGRRVRQKAGLNRAILDQGWGEFRRQLAYKCAWRGGRLEVVPPQYTSQTCPASAGGCGHVGSENRATQAQFRCVACGFEGHADVVGATNVLSLYLNKLSHTAAGLAVAACGGAAQSGAPLKQEPTETTQAALVAA